MKFKENFALNSFHLLYRELNQLKKKEIKQTFWAIMTVNIEINICER
jgi:hypothetical protein